MRVKWKRGVSTKVEAYYQTVLDPGFEKWKLRTAKILQKLSEKRTISILFELGLEIDYLFDMQMKNYYSSNLFYFFMSWRDKDD